MRDTLPDRDGIARTIDLYFAGMYQSKAEDIEASFHPNATVTGYHGGTGELVEMNYEAFRDFVSSQPPPAKTASLSK